MGPGVSILLRSPLTKQQIDDLEAWLCINTEDLQGKPMQWQFMMKEDSLQIGSDHSSDDLRSIGLSAFDSQMDDTELQQAVTGLGYIPQQELALGAMAKSSLDHRILGYLALFLAERYNGMIDIGGAVSGKRKEDWQPRLKAINGRAIEIMDESPSECGVYHILDTTFMLGWLRDPDFRLVN